MIRFNIDEEVEWIKFFMRLPSFRRRLSATEKFDKRIDFQRFGVELHEEDFKQGGTPYGSVMIRDRTEARVAASGFSEIQDDDEKFQITIDVWPFKSNELMIIFHPYYYLLVVGEHEEKYEDNSICTRRFMRRYILPEGCGSEVQACKYREWTLTIRVDKETKKNEEVQKVPIEIRLENLQRVQINVVKDVAAELKDVAAELKKEAAAKLKKDVAAELKDIAAKLKKDVAAEPQLPSGNFWIVGDKPDPKKADSESRKKDEEASN